MERSLAQPILHDLDERIVLLSGPRQSGKTTLSLMLFEKYDYFNYDLAEHRLALNEKNWDRTTEAVIFDELHKKRDWKRWLKGVVDTEGVRPRLLVTGSAKLDLIRKMGDSLAGRYFQHRLHPLDIKELCGELPAEEALDRLMRMGGFPEPFLRGSERFYKRWRRSHLDIILRQDLLDLEAVRNIQAIETLVELLKHRVGSPVSYNSLARDLERDSKTIKRWLTLLENLYVIFRVAPYHRNIARSLLKEPKFYFYDTGLVLSGEGAKLENLVACALKKELDRVEDQHGDAARLHYLRTRDGRELDFAVVVEDRIRDLIEVKLADPQPSRAFRQFGQFVPEAGKVQVVRDLDRDRTYPDGLEVRAAAQWLRTLQYP